jgi:hypothetical protein
MTLAGFARALRAFTERRPFRPYMIEFHSGNRVRVSHPEAAAIRGDVTVYRSPANQHRLFDSTSVCQLLDIETPGPATGG